ncbi:MAG: isocitrate lyase/phosphoenolpyruvate mutase family protein [Spirochaetota bacterium]
MNGRTKLKNLIDNGEMVIAIGAHDAFSARLIEQAGFNAVYIGSYVTEAAFMGKPDLALMPKTERLLIARNIVKAVNLPVIADMEEGYGNAISVMDVIRDFEAAGLAAVHIDDEAMPSKCPFISGIPPNKLISVDEMCGKIKAAKEARQDPNFKIIVRSDVIGTVSKDIYYRDHMIEEVVQRSNAYARAGADAIFVMALNVDEVNYFAETIEAPLVGIFASVEPIAIKEFEKASYQMVIGSLVGLYMAARGMIDGLQALKKTGDWNAVLDKMIDDEEFFNIVGIQEYEEMYKRFGIP